MPEETKKRFEEFVENVRVFGEYPEALAKHTLSFIESECQRREVALAGRIRDVIDNQLISTDDEGKAIRHVLDNLPA